MIASPITMNTIDHAVFSFRYACQPCINEDQKQPSVRTSKTYQNSPREFKHANNGEDNTIHNGILKHSAANGIDPECRSSDCEERGELKEDRKE